MTNLAALILQAARRECEARSRRLGTNERPGAVPPSFAASGGSKTHISNAARAADTAILKAMAESPKTLADLAGATGMDRKVISSRLVQVKANGCRTAKQTRVDPKRSPINLYSITEQGRAFLAGRANGTKIDGDAPTSAAQPRNAENHMTAYLDAEQPSARKSDGFRATVFVRTIQTAGRPDRDVRISLAPDGRKEAR